MPNVELAQQVLEQIEEHPDTWDQGYWARETASCGTTHCFAGWAVALAEPDAQFAIDFDGLGTGVIRRDGEPWEIKDAAIDLLGLTSWQADAMFWHSTTLDELREYVRQLEETGSFEPSARFEAWENDTFDEDEDEPDDD